MRDIQCVRCPTMPDYRDQYGASAWTSTRQAIAEGLRQRYEPPAELPRRLLALATQLCAMEHDTCPQDFPSPVANRRLPSPEQRSVLNRSMLVNHLGQTKCRIRERERLIFRQRQIIDELECHGHGRSQTANMARDLLQSDEMAQSAYILDRDRLVQWLQPRP